MANELDRRFGEALRTLREASGKTQEDFSGIGRSYLSELERGLKTPTLDTIVRLADELGVAPTRLVELATTADESLGDRTEKLALPRALSDGLSMAAEHKGGEASAAFTEATTLAAVGKAMARAEIELAHLLAEAALAAFRLAPGRNPRERRQRLRFIVADRRPAAGLRFAVDEGVPWSFTPEAAFLAIERANLTLGLADDVLGMNGIPFYELLGTRNLGSFVGAVYGYSLRLEMPDQLMVNGHQDGYPDLCALTTEGKEYVARTRADGMEAAKKSWASYPFGGIEIKTTCGAVPTPTKARKKPGIGDPRASLLTGADWKAHHRETNNLLGLFWDFIDGVPTVIGLFYRNDLTEADWGEVVLPASVGDVKASMDDENVVELVDDPTERVADAKATGDQAKKRGRTTSVSIMTGAAVKKMGKGWVVLPGNPELLAALGRPRIFDLGVTDVEPLTSKLPDEARDVLATLDRERQEQQQALVAKLAKRPRAPRKD